MSGHFRNECVRDHYFKTFILDSKHHVIYHCKDLSMLISNMFSVFRWILQIFRTKRIKQPIFLRKSCIFCFISSVMGHFDLFISIPSHPFIYEEKIDKIPFLTCDIFSYRSVRYLVCTFIDNVVELKQFSQFSSQLSPSVSF